MKEQEAIRILKVNATISASQTTFCEAVQVATAALEEIQKYRALGTVEEVEHMSDELDRWHTDRINKNIKNPFAYTSTLICHNCDHKDDYIEELEAKIEQYEAIGTVEECREAVEKQTPKKPVTYPSTNRADCFICGATVRGIKDPFGDYCSKCGHAIEWGKEPYIGEQHENT